jgi:hypothetical protein
MKYIFIPTNEIVEIGNRLAFFIEGHKVIVTISAKFILDNISLFNKVQ